MRDVLAFRYRGRPLLVAAAVVALLAPPGAGAAAEGDAAQCFLAGDMLAPRVAGDPCARAQAGVSAVEAATAASAPGLTRSASGSSRSAPGQPCPAIPAADERCEAWVAVHDSPDVRGNWSVDFQLAQALSPVGDRLFVAGAAGNAGSASFDIAVAAVEPETGAELWRARHASGPGGGDFAWAIAASPDGRSVYVTGERDSDGHSTGDIVTMAFDAETGETRWTATYDATGSERDAGMAVDVAPDGSVVYVTGLTYSATDSPRQGAPGSDITTIAYASATGAVQWMANYDGAGDWVDMAYDVVATPDGSSVVVGGISYGETPPDSPGDGFLGYDMVVVSYAASGPQAGTQQWARRNSSMEHGFDIVYGVAASADGSTVYATGLSQYETVMAEDIHRQLYNGAQTALALDARTGEVRWAYGHRGFGALNTGADIVADPDGERVFMTGYLPESHRYDYDYGTVALDARDGRELWVRRFDSGFNDVALGVAVSGDHVYVTGSSNVQRTPVPVTATAWIGTIAYDAASGDQVWIAKYGVVPAAATLGFGTIDASQDGRRVYVSGTQLYPESQAGTGSVNRSDFVIVAYDAE